MLSTAGRLRGCAWSGGSPWGSPPGQDRRSFSRFQSLSYRQTFPVAVFSWQKLAPGVVFPYGSWLCWKKLRSGNCRETRWVRSVRQFLHRKESYRRKGGEGADRLGMESSRCWAAEHERISFRESSAGAHSAQAGKAARGASRLGGVGRAASRPAAGYGKGRGGFPELSPESAGGLGCGAGSLPRAPAARSFAAVADSAGGLRRSWMSGRRREAFSRFAVVFRKGRADRSPAAAFPPGTPVQAAWLLRKIPLDKLFILCILGIYNMNGGVTWRS